MACRPSSAGASVDTQLGLDGQGVSVVRGIPLGLYPSAPSPATRRLESAWRSGAKHRLNSIRDGGQVPLRLVVRLYADRDPANDAAILGFDIDTPVARIEALLECVRPKPAVTASGYPKRNSIGMR